jgi:hypothetical protein
VVVVGAEVEVTVDVELPGGPVVCVVDDVVVVDMVVLGPAVEVVTVVEVGAVVEVVTVVNVVDGARVVVVVGVAVVVVVVVASVSHVQDAVQRTPGSHAASCPSHCSPRSPSRNPSPQVDCLATKALRTRARRTRKVPLMSPQFAATVADSVTRPRRLPHRFHDARKRNVPPGARRSRAGTAGQPIVSETAGRSPSVATTSGVTDEAPVTSGSPWTTNRVPGQGNTTRRRARAGEVVRRAAPATSVTAIPPAIARRNASFPVGDAGHAPEGACVGSRLVFTARSLSKEDATRVGTDARLGRPIAVAAKRSRPSADLLEIYRKLTQTHAGGR